MDINNEITELFKDGYIHIFNTRKDCIEFLIDEYSFDWNEDIFEEFINYIKENKEYDLNLRSYVDGTYSDKIFQYKSIYVVDLYEETSYESFDNFVHSKFDGDINKLKEFYSICRDFTEGDDCECTD